MSIEAMKLALEVLEKLWLLGDQAGAIANPAITALRQALEQAQKQEPYKGIAEHLNQATNGRIRIDHVTGDFGIGSIEQAQKQEPVAWRGYNWGHSPDDWVYRDFDDPILDGNGNNVGQPLYTSPPQRQPLTDEQITSVWETRPYFNDFARAIEAAHGIKEKNT